MATQQEDRAISRLRITAALTCVAIAALPVGAAAADRGDGSAPGRSGEAPGQVTKDQGTHAAQPAAPPEQAAGTPARSHGAAASDRATPPKHGGKAEHAAKPKHHGAPASKPAPSSHAKAGKTTICHATGSATNPYVTITISDNALPAHRRHQDGRDIVPAPAGGCPKGSAAASQQEHPGEHGDAGDHGRSKVTICHATGSATNPYVTITIAEPAVAAHRRHQDGRDIVPAPAGGCPGTTTTTASPGVTEGATPPPVPSLAGSGTTPAVAPLSDYATTLPQAGGSAPAVLGESVTSPSAGTSPAGGAGPQVLGETASSGTAPATEAGALSSGSLPFTGWDAALAALVAAALLLTGVAARRAATHRR